ncbi:ufm1-conjugating enzyme 1, putative [Ichthyophthirius multifiliis]|uniref:Ubiquitin-fold modifier-conjugating enzyme 1 n=1 Tax=Ichthyophthirius multifiliis TaxID=5932 RepID=G0QJ62_ICHMU|nr:ufm1-conjugating enzyme 1, putative [Ichthyophthirius multifiliis]EGR34743.1 ufm1-conjugating enzyme 1, putative [Ichthyophthirius multifiliis]|eukprot:XP_004040047.1 ufm1-conjugating enzyme 1, putative [Ichthyophthirius multifiliis]
MDSDTRSVVEKIPLLKINTGPRNPNWIDRLKEEYIALIKYIEINKSQDNDWFKVESDKEGKKWKGRCWYIHNLVRYEFDLQFEIPATYPSSPIELELPELDGKTHKMYRGGKICLDIHFSPLWSKNCPKFGIAHALALGLGPWLAAEIPILIEQGVIQKN